MSRIYNFNKFKLLEWQGDDKNLPRPEYIKYLDELQEKIRKEIDLPKGFDSEYIRGKRILINTGNNDDMVISIDVKNDQISYNIKPVKGTSIESGVNLPFTSDTSGILRMIKNDIKDNKGKEFAIKPKTKTKKSKKDTNEEDIEEYDFMSDLETPITKRPIRRRRSIEIRTIMSVLEDAYIVDDIDLKNISAEELVRRMLLASRK